MQAMFVAVFQGQLHLISMQKIPMRLAQHAEVSYFIFGLKSWCESLVIDLTYLFLLIQLQLKQLVH